MQTRDESRPGVEIRRRERAVRVRERILKDGAAALYQQTLELLVFKGKLIVGTEPVEDGGRVAVMDLDLHEVEMHWEGFQADERAGVDQGWPFTMLGTTWPKHELVDSIAELWWEA